MTVARVVLLVVAGFLLLSMGGAIFAAPVTIPMLWVATRSTPSRAFRVAAAVVGGLTTSEVAWAALYVAAGEPKPAIWLVPAVAAIATAIAFARGKPHRRVVAA